MKLLHQPWHWAAVGAVLAVAVFTLSEARGQSVGAAAMYEGRPAMAGAQAGLGAQAGPPQGGIGPQSPSDPAAGVGARRALPPSRTMDVAAGPMAPRDPGLDPLRDGGLQPQRDRDSGNVVKRTRDEGSATSGNRAKSKAKRAGKRTLEQKKHGVSGVDSVTQ